MAAKGMQEVVLATRISGTRNGIDWPGYGHAVILPEGEAALMIEKFQAFDPKAGPAGFKGKYKYSGPPAVDMCTDAEKTAAKAGKGAKPGEAATIGTVAERERGSSDGDDE